jgi:hypothetical protein
MTKMTCQHRGVSLIPHYATFGAGFNRSGRAGGLATPSHTSWVDSEAAAPPLPCRYGGSWNTIVCRCSWTCGWPMKF